VGIVFSSTVSLKLKFRGDTTSGYW